VQLPSHSTAAFPAPLRSTLCALALAALICSLAPACGTDSEHPYASLSRARVERDQAGYVLRYLAPPWERLEDDPLAKGTRKSVSIGGTSTAILAESGVVLEIEHISNSGSSEALTFPKYRLEAALVPCMEEDVGDLSCAEHLAQLDYAARQEEGPVDLLGSKPRARKNDWNQTYYELMGQSETTGRFRRVIFFESSTPERVAGWILIEANPDLGEREVTELVRAFEMLPGTEAEP
jgi:hypothetical protein